MSRVGMWLLLAALALVVIRFSACVADSFDLADVPDYYDPPKVAK